MTLEGIANLIEEQLKADNNAAAFGLTFKVFTDAGDFEEGYKNPESKLVNAVLLETSGDFTPVKEVSSKFMNLELRFAVTQEDVAKFKQVLESWSNKQLGVAYKEEETGKTYILTPSAPSTGTAFNVQGVDSCVPISVVLEVQITSLGLIGSESVWKIGDDVINVLNWKYISSRTQQTCESLEADETTAANQMASGSFVLVIPVAKTEACKSLYNDILNNNKDTIYKIKMTDGWSAGIDGDYVMINGVIDSEQTKINAMTCTFSKSNKTLE